LDLSIVIINFNTRALTEQTIRSVFDSTKRISFEIILVDNSTKQEEKMLPQEDERIILLSDVENKGFGNGCNLGAQQAHGDYVLFLNSDTIVHEEALDRCVEYMRDHPDVGGLGIHTLLKDGTLDHGCKRGFPTPMASLYYFTGMDRRHPESKKYGAYRQTFLDENETNDTDCVSGAFLMMPKKVLEQLGGFDERFFMYGEDVDLCYRVKEAGYRIVYFAEASMTHLKGSSGLHTKSKTVIYHFYHAMTLFYDKHYKKKYPFFVTWIVHLGIRAKYAMTLLKMKRKG
jgi:GT2 family glycosyltransferase